MDPKRNIGKIHVSNIKKGHINKDIFVFILFIFYYNQQMHN